MIFKNAYSFLIFGLMSFGCYGGDGNSYVLTEAEVAYLTAISDFGTKGLEAIVDPGTHLVLRGSTQNGSTIDDLLNARDVAVRVTVFEGKDDWIALKDQIAEKEKVI